MHGSLGSALQLARREDAVEQPIGRRERNKQEKARRITAAARDLFAARDVDTVTTQEVADLADVATGTLFLYARSKGELLLLAHNSAYEEALERGTAAAAAETDVVGAVMAVVAEVVACNRTRPANGRAYLRETVFGDPSEPHHAAALDLSRRTEVAVAGCLARFDGRSEAEAATLARVVTGVMLLAMASPMAVSSTVEDVVEDVRRQVAVLVG